MAKKEKSKKTMAEKISGLDAKRAELQHGGGSERIAKQHASAPVGLQTMLVGINKNRVGLVDQVVRGAGFLRQI